MIQKLLCKIGLHQWDFVSSTGDWLNGGIYLFKCKSCPKTRNAQRWNV